MENKEVVDAFNKASTDYDKYRTLSLKHSFFPTLLAKDNSNTQKKIHS